MEVLKIRDINGNWIEIPYLKGDIPGLSEYQKKLTAGTNITIDENNVISATGGGVTEEQVNTLIDSKTTSYNFKVGEEPTTKGLDILNNLWNKDVAYNYAYGNLAIFLEGVPVQLIKDGNVFRLSGTYNQFTSHDPHSEIYCGTITPTLTNGVITSYTVALGGTHIDGMRILLTGNAVSKLIDDKAISYNFIVNENNTDVGLRIVKDLWSDTTNFTKYNLTYNGEPVHNVFKDEINYNNKLIFTILRADYQNPSGPVLVGRLINLTFENNEIVSYTVSGSNAGGQYVVGHTDAQINTLIDNKNLQPKLTAGNNITIDANNVISSTGGSSSGVEIIDHNITQDELFSMPSKLFCMSNNAVITLNVYLQETGSVEELGFNSYLCYWNSEFKQLEDLVFNKEYVWQGEVPENPREYFAVGSTFEFSDGLIDTDGIISVDGAAIDGQINVTIDSKNLQPKLTAGTNITIEGNVISATDTGVSEERVNQLIDTKLGVIENGSY